MATTRTFSLDAVLAVTHGFPVHYRTFALLMQWVSGEEFSTPPDPSQILRWVPLVKAELLRQIPQLKRVPPRPDFGDDEAAMDAWSADQAQALRRSSFAVAPMQGRAS